MSKPVLKKKKTPRKSFLHIRMLKAHIKQHKKSAKKAGKSFSDWVRDALMDA